MAENISRTINWSELYNSYELTSILRQINSITVQEVQVDNEFRFSLIEGIDRYASSLTTTFELIPNEVIIEKNKSLTYVNKKTITLENYPQILNFVSNYATYIDEFIKDQNIETVEIISNENIINSRDSDNIYERLKSIESTKNWLNRENNEELIPLILAALMKRFYQQDSKPLKIKASSVLTRIKSNINYVNSLLEINVDELKKYAINYNMDNCVDIGNFLTGFTFITNKMFQTPYFEMYKQNIDLKFLSYISRASLKEMAETCRR